MRLFAGVLLMCTMVLQAQEAVTIDADIVRVRKELAQVLSDRTRTQNEMAKDRTEFDDYRARTKTRMKQLGLELDSLNSRIRSVTNTHDSLQVRLSGIESTIKQYDLLQDDFRQRLVAGCRMLDSLAQRFPPMVAKTASSSLRLLASELVAKSVENIESVSRIGQICGQMEEYAASVQIGQESSTIPEIRGMVYRLRVGTFFEAIVDVKGEKVLFWRGSDEKGVARWEPTDDVEIAAAVLRAVNIREGRQTPDFARLPLQYAVGTTASAGGSVSDTLARDHGGAAQ